MYYSICKVHKKIYNIIEVERKSCYNKKKIDMYFQGGEFMFANTIKEILEDYKKAGKSLTQNDLANVLEMTKQSFSNKMQRDTFTAEDVVKIANYLNMQAVLKGDNEYVIK